ncbi:MAG: hypothetical protein AAGC93_21180 [Cyanobacteria bacterium P01_F01_bin.53]
MIQLTATACQEINRLRQRQNQPDALCRLDLQPSSCGQWSYSLSFPKTSWVAPSDLIIRWRLKAAFADMRFPFASVISAQMRPTEQASYSL